MSLEGKYGPGVPRDAPEAAARRLAAYGRAARAALAAREGPAAAPVAQLSDTQLAALFTPRHLAALVTRPLAPASPECEGK